MGAIAVHCLVAGPRMSVSGIPTPLPACPPSATIRPSGSATAPLQDMPHPLCGTGVNTPVVGFHNWAVVPPFDGGPSQERTSPVRVISKCTATIFQLNGAVQVPTTAGSLVLETVKVAGAEVVMLPD